MRATLIDFRHVSQIEFWRDSEEVAADSLRSPPHCRMALNQNAPDPFQPSTLTSTSLEACRIYFSLDPRSDSRGPGPYHPWLGDKCDDKRFAIDIPPAFPCFQKASTLLRLFQTRIDHPNEEWTREEAAVKFAEWQREYRVKVLLELYVPLEDTAIKLLGFLGILLGRVKCKDISPHSIYHLDQGERALMDREARNKAMHFEALYGLLSRSVTMIKSSRGVYFLIYLMDSRTS